MFEGWRVRVEQLLSDLTPDTDPRERAVPLRQAMIELKLELQAMGDGLDATKRQVEDERRHLADVERRGLLAAAVPDEETVRIAEEFAGRHRERITML